MLEDTSSGVTQGPADPVVVGPGREVETGHGPPGNVRTPSLPVVQCALDMSLTKSSRTEALLRLEAETPVYRIDGSITSRLERSERSRVEEHGTGGLSRVTQNQNSVAVGARLLSVRGNTLGLPPTETLLESTHSNL